MPSVDPIDGLLSEADRTFRQEVRDFIAVALPAEARRNADIGRHATKSEVVFWQKALNARGWAAPSWPEEYGGAGWSPLRQLLFNLECGLGAAPKVPAFGTRMVGPVIYAFGSEAQKSFYLPRILSADDWWCQGFSEPGAGSDLAGLRTRAVRKGDRYVVDGQKIWTTKAQHANRMFALVRTDDSGRKQDGISFLLLDMDSPGIEVRPIISIDGSHTLNEVFLSGVEVPAENLVGEEGKGWAYARFLLANERSDISGAGRSRRQLARIRAAMHLPQPDGLPLAQAPSFMAALAEVEIALTALELTELRYLAVQAQGGDIGGGASILKLRGTEIQQEMTRLLREAIGAEAAMAGPEATGALARLDAAAAELSEGVIEEYLYGRASSIYGGTNEIQRSLLARGLLGAEGGRG
ncbi:acyl-CoA dehydrogenase family protein [Nitratireductor alexandrii]|uniref:acyl-CoA dehydrogenase family protein n=1 Tax=Nitratireductor alexandrii TaxID=2448161 RepID=UPI000FDA6100|nr:acyl-CoA dehydrogenase family protein [Nitratireductor alexandrii]